MSRPKVAIRQKDSENVVHGGRFVRYDQDVAAIRAAKKSVELTIGSWDIIQPGTGFLNLTRLSARPSFAVVDPRTVEASGGLYWKSQSGRNG